MDHVDEFRLAMQRISTPALPQSNGKSSASDWLGFDPEWPQERSAVLQLRTAQEKVAAWVNGAILGLVLAGHPGAGKSHLARVAVGHISDPLRAVLIDEAQLVADLHAAYGGGNRSEAAIIGKLKRIPMVIIDDVGTAHVRDESAGWLRSIYWRILDNRAEWHMPLMLTTNLATPDLAARLGARGFSRLIGLMKGDDGQVDRSNLVDMFEVPDYRLRGY